MSASFMENMKERLGLGGGEEKGLGYRRKGLGAKGESLAARHLKKQGFAIVERNFNCTLGEIDIIARKGDLLVFAEVKTRMSKHYGAPEQSVNFPKQKKITRVAKCYLKNKKLGGLNCRFDVYAITFDDAQRPEIKHIPSAFNAVD